MNKLIIYIIIFIWSGLFVYLTGDISEGILCFILLSYFEFRFLNLEKINKI